MKKDLLMILKGLTQYLLMILFAFSVQISFGQKRMIHEDVLNKKNIKNDGISNADLKLIGKFDNKDNIVAKSSRNSKAASWNYTTNTGNVGTTYSWIDCSGGTSLTLGDDEEDSFNWPFSFSFYDDSYTTSNSISVCSNGFIRLDGTATTSYSPASGYTLGSTSTELGQIIAMGTQDCDVSGTGWVRYLVTGSSPNRVLTIEYNNLEIDYNDNNHADIQVSLYETSNVIVLKLGSDDVTATGADLGIHSGTDNYYDDWQDVDNGTNNRWIEYTPYASPEKSTITAGGTSEPASIASTIDTQGEAIVNFDFILTDDGLDNSYDTKNLLFNTLVVKQGTGNDVATWSDAISGAELSDGTNTISGTINATNITFSSIANASSSDLGYIADNGNKTYTLKVWLKSSLGGTLPATIDGDNLVFLVNESSFTLEATSSGFASGETENSGATNNEVTVTATQLMFTGQPTSTATSGVALSTQPIVSATDENGNTDADITSNVTLSNSGGLAMSNNSMNFVAGVADFGTPNNFMFTTGGKYVMLSASDGSLNSISPSTEIAVDIVGCTIFTEDFNSVPIDNDLTGAGGWEYTETTNSPNDWGIGNSGANRFLTIYNDNTQQQYNNGNDGEIIAYYNSSIDATNFKNLSIDFDWQCTGENTFDYGTVVWSTDGINWSVAEPTQYSNQGTFTSATGVDLSVCDGQQFYIGFRWINDGSLGTNPPFAVDNIVIRGFPKFDYNFSYRQDTYEAITGTVVTLDGQAGANISLPAGFDFAYDGTAVASVRANENGWLEMGTSQNTVLASNDLSDVANTPLLAPFWDDLSTDAQTKIIYLVEGTAPSRTFTIEWRDALWGTKRENFQVKLYETSYVIEFWYGAMNTNSSGSASIGINNAGGCMNKMISVIPGTIPTVSYTAENNSINSTTYLNSGLVYIFNPLQMQSYQSWQTATVLIGQSDWDQQSTNVDQSTTPHPSSAVISSKNVLAVGEQGVDYSATDIREGRILLWNSVPTTNGVAADLVLGKSDFNDVTGGCTAQRVNSINGVCFTPDGEKLLAADYKNNRVLIWNTIPTSNFTAADVVVGQTDFVSNVAPSPPTASSLNGPTDLFVLPDGKLVIADFVNYRVLIYNSIPTTNGVAADIVIGQSDFVSTNNGCSNIDMERPWGIGYSPEGELFITDPDNNRILVYTDVPTTNGANADRVIGQPNFTSNSSGTSKTKFYTPVSVTISPESKMAVCEFLNHRTLVYNQVPSFNGGTADYVLGQPNFLEAYKFNDGISQTDLTTPDNRNMQYAYATRFDLNGRLLVVGRDMRRTMLYGDAPTETADLELSIVANETNVCIYSDVEYTVQVTNNGGDAANSVVVNAQLPVGFIANDYDASVGTYNQKSGYWTIPYIAVGETVTLTFEGEVQPGLAGTSVTAYANIIASKQKDSDFSNNGASEVVAVRTYYAPTSTDIADQYINRNSHTNPVISFTVDDQDVGDLAGVTYSNTSSNTTLIPINYTTNLVYAGTAPNKTLDITPVLNEYGYSDMELVLTDAHGCHKSYDFKVAVGNIWEGNGSILTPNSETKWDETENWSSGIVPSNTIEAIIPTTPKGGYFPIIDVAGAECLDMIIEPKASVTLNDTYGLTINGDLIIQSDVTGTGSLVDLNANGNISTKGNITVQRYIINDAWHYVSTPLNGVTNKVLTENVCGANYNGNVLDYNEAYVGVDWLVGWEWPWLTVHNNDPLVITNGYAYYSVAGQCSNLIEFTGASVSLNTGNFTYNVTNQDENFKPTGTNPHRGWNLVGNPYPSGLNADDFMSANSGVIDGTVYFWDELGSTGFDNEGADYAAYNTSGGGVTGSGSGSVIPDQYISCGQAFYVHRTHTDVGGSNISFANSMREAENSFFFKKDKQITEVPKVKLNVINSQNMYNEIVVMLVDDATNEVNPKYDGYKPEGNPNLSFYSIKDESAFLFQGIKPLMDNEYKIVPLGIHAGIAGKYIFGANLIEYIDDNIGVFLEDKELNKIVDLRKQKYSVTINETGRYNDRFVLHFNINHSPYVVNEIPDKTINCEEFTSFDIQANTFADSDNDELTYSASLVNGSKLPNWLNFNSETRTFSGTPSNNDAKLYRMRVTATDIFGASVYDDFNLTVLSATGVAGVGATEVSVYPNPTSGMLYIKTNVQNGFTYQITDVTGKIIFETNSTSLKEEVDISKLTSGIYFVKVVLGDKTSDFKIFLQK